MPPSNSTQPIPPPAQLPPQPLFDAELLSQLACPAYHAGLRLETAHLVCSACAHLYPIVDGIPILIDERADAR